MGKRSDEARARARQRKEQNSGTKPEPQEASLTQWEEYRRRRLAIQRQAVRRVRNTLIILAILAGLWFLYLCAKQ